VRLQRLVMPETDATSWTVIGDDGDPVAPVEAYLVHLSALERSPETVRAYAISLKLWFEFLARVDLAWDGVSIEDVSTFVSGCAPPRHLSTRVSLDGVHRSPSTATWPACSVSMISTPATGWPWRRVWSPGDGAAGVPTSPFCITSRPAIRFPPARSS
jgi:Phage integrase, N-terminal SAM-like domain